MGSEKPSIGDLARNNGEIEKKLDEIARAKPIAKWKTYIKGKQYGVVISLLQENTIAGTLNVFEDGSRSMYVDIFGVREELQSRGLGTRLLRNLTAEAVSYGATILSGHVTSESALKTRARVFGRDNLQFYNHATGEKMNLTFGDALLVEPDFDVVVDLTKVNVADWEKPQRDDD